MIMEWFLIVWIHTGFQTLSLGTVGPMPTLAACEAARRGVREAGEAEAKRYSPATCKERVVVARNEPESADSSTGRGAP
jgi:hypothetical protein